MKLLVCFILLTMLNVSGSIFSQGTFDLTVKDKTVKEVFRDIERQSQYRFLSNDDFAGLNRMVSLNTKDGCIDNVLNELLAGANLTYRELENDLIVITPEIDLQQHTVQGIVTDSRGNPLPGVTVLLIGTNRGTVTNVDGRYSLSEVPADGTLEFSFVGMITERRLIDGQSNLDLVLSEDLLGLEEVVVVGYGTQKKINLTGSVASVNFETDEMSSRPITNLSTALAGLSSGVLVTQSQGHPSSDGSTIRIRGTGTLNVGSSPLILIDGQPGDINSIHPDEVASVSVLKDAASSAIYGSRAANGVILITTKTGYDSEGRITFNYSGNTAFASPTRLFDVVTYTPDHMGLTNLIRKNSGLPPIFSEEFINEWRAGTDPIMYPNTDWWDVVITPNTIQNHSISARGGTNKLNFFSSLGYLNNNGIVEKTTYERYNFRLNLDYDVTDWLKLGSNTTAFQSKADPVSTATIFNVIHATTPGIYPQHPDGRYGGTQTGGAELIAAENAPLWKIASQLGENNTQNYANKLFVILSPIEGLSINGSYFSDIQHYDAWASSRPINLWDFRNDVILDDKETKMRLSLSNSSEKRQRYIYDLFASYDKALGNHRLNGLIGYNQEYYKYNEWGATKRDLYSLDIPVLDAAPSEPQASGNSHDFALRSYFGRVNYDFKGKYLLEANIRYDGSSRFSPDNRWGSFPSFSAAWIVSEEPFWMAMEGRINQFKLRGSWGQLGNMGIGNYEWQNTYGPANHSFAGIIVQGMAQSEIANTDITWETTDVLNIGIDMSLFTNLFLTLDYYDKFTHGILARIPIPFASGGLTPPRVNSAEVRNTGIEGDVRYNTRIGDINIGFSVNGSFNNNRIERYKGDYLEPHGQGVWTEGQPIGIFWVREIDRIVQEKSEIDALINDGWTFHPSVPGPGDFLYKDNTNDKIINDADRVLKGNPLPKFNYGGSLNLGYKGIDLYALVYGIKGWDKYLSWGYFNLQPRVDGYSYSKDLLNSWTPENRSTTVPKLYTNNSKNSQQSDYFLHDASFLRIRTIQLGYTIPASLTQGIGIEKLRAHVNLENFFTFTSFPVMDPETSSIITYPLMKTISFGLNMSL